MLGRGLGAHSSILWELRNFPILMASQGMEKFLSKWNPLPFQVWTAQMDALVRDQNWPWEVEKAAPVFSDPLFSFRATLAFGTTKVISKAHWVKAHYTFLYSYLISLYFMWVEIEGTTQCLFCQAFWVLTLIGVRYSIFACYKIVGERGHFMTKVSLREPSMSSITPYIRFLQRILLEAKSSIIHSLSLLLK